MRHMMLAVALTAISGLFARHAEAQQLQQPVNARPVSTNYVYYLQDEPAGPVGSPSDVPVTPEADGEAAPEAPPAIVPVPAAGDEAEYVFEDPEVEEAEEEEEECEDEGPVRLFECCSDCFEVGGWINFGIYQNGDGVRSGTGNAPLGFVNVSDGATLNQAWIYAQKSLPDCEECGCCCKGWGGRIDYVFGADGPDTQAFAGDGWDTQWDSGRDYGSAIPQLYLEYGNSDFSIKAGHFYTLIGYEVVTAPDNFFYSHAYTMLYGEPFTHTGVLATKQLNSQVSVTGGWTQGWDTGFDDSNGGSTFLGSASYTTCDEKTTIIYSVTAGDYGNGNVSNVGDIYMHSVVVTHQINECLEYVFHHDYFLNSDNPAVADNEVTAGGLNQYLFWTKSNCIKYGLRAEWFNDDEGQRVATNDPTYAGGDFYAVTAGVNYTPNSNVIIRPEVRYDWFHGTGNPFADGTADDQFFYGVDMIVLF